MNEDKLEKMWQQQTEFMKLLQEKRSFPKFPVDITSKQGQKLLKDIQHHCMDELFESGQHLKNHKSHRASDIPDIDYDAYVEELADALHLFIEICIASGISLDELYDVYMKKGEKNTNRILSGY